MYAIHTTFKSIDVKYGSTYKVPYKCITPLLVNHKQVLKSVMLTTPKMTIPWNKTYSNDETSFNIEFSNTNINFTKRLYDFCRKVVRGLYNTSCDNDDDDDIGGSGSGGICRINNKKQQTTTDTTNANVTMMDTDMEGTTSDRCTNDDTLSSINDNSNNKSNTNSLRKASPITTRSKTRQAKQQKLCKSSKKQLEFIQMKTYTNDAMTLRFYNVKINDVLVYNERGEQLSVTELGKDDTVKIMIQFHSVVLKESTDKVHVDMRLIQVMKMSPNADVNSTMSMLSVPVRVADTHNVSYNNSNSNGNTVATPQNVSPPPAPPVPPPPPPPLHPFSSTATATKRPSTTNLSSGGGGTSTSKKMNYQNMKALSSLSSISIDELLKARMRSKKRM